MSDFDQELLDLDIEFERIVKVDKVDPGNLAVEMYCRHYVHLTQASMQLMVLLKEESSDRWLMDCI